jgi:hypothetical protein
MVMVVMAAVLVTAAMLAAVGTVLTQFFRHLPLAPGQTVEMVVQLGLQVRAGKVVPAGQAG